MNTWKQTYPEDITNLVDSAKLIATKVLDDLNSPICPTLNDFYQEKDGRVYRIKEEFTRIGYRPNSQLDLKKESINEFKGLYVFGEVIRNKVVPVYVGISRTIFRRLRQHGWGKNHNECTLAYLIAKDYYPKLSSELKREEFPKGKLEEMKNKLRSFKVVMHPIENDFELYFLEVSIAGILKTKWNSFKTH